jgi:hypothetical protein
VVNGISAGTGFITYTLSATGCKQDTSIIVTGLPAAGIITGPGSLCTGTAITLGDTIAGGVWSSGGLLTTVSGGVVNGLLTGSDTITYSVTNFCGTTIAIKAITIDPVPVAGMITGVDSLCVGNVAALADADAGGTWTSSNINATISTSGVVSGINAGMDTIMYTVSNSWCSASTDFVVKIIPLDQCLSLSVAPGLVSVSDEWKVWPNPATGEITISTGRRGILSLLNIQGQLILKFQVKEGDNNISLPADLSDGAYLLELLSDDGVRSITKLVVTK